jgi:hypothetical protein
MSVPERETGALVVEHELRDGLTIGRSGENDVILAASTVSGRHAALMFSAGGWGIKDLDSENGTFVNGVRIPAGRPRVLRHGDRIRLGSASLVFSWPASNDRNLTPAVVADAMLPLPSAFQLQVVRCLCGAWLSGAGLDRLPSNEEIAAQLGIPGAVEAVKAALRRVYAKTGLTGLPPQVKRRELCRIAQEQRWL